MELTCCIFSKSKQGRWMWWWDRWRCRLRGDPVLLPLATVRAAGGGSLADNMAVGAAISWSARKNFGGGERERVGRWAPSGGDVRNSRGNGESWAPTKDWTSSSDEAEQSKATLLMLRSINSPSNSADEWCCCNMTADRGRVLIRSDPFGVRRWFTWPHFLFSGPCCWNSFTLLVPNLLHGKRKKKTNLLRSFARPWVMMANMLLLVVVLTSIRAKTRRAEGTGTKTKSRPSRCRRWRE